MVWRSSKCLQRDTGPFISCVLFSVGIGYLGIEKSGGLMSIFKTIIFFSRLILNSFKPSEVIQQGNVLTLAFH